MVSQDYSYINTQLYYMFKDTVFIFSLQSFNRLSASVLENQTSSFKKLCVLDCLKYPSIHKGLTTVRQKDAQGQEQGESSGES